MPIAHFIIDLFCRVESRLGPLARHPQEKLALSELLTLGLLFALKGIGKRAFYRWVKDNWLHFFPDLPERTRFFRRLTTQARLTKTLLAEPTILGVADSYGIELLHPRREGRTAEQLGTKGLSNKRWIVGAKFYFIANQFGRIVDWDLDQAHVHDKRFLSLIAKYEDRMVVFTDEGSISKDFKPANLRPCSKGVWNDRMGVETITSMMTLVAHTKKMMERKAAPLIARVAYLVAIFNLLLDWDGLVVEKDGFVPMHMARVVLLLSLRRTCATRLGLTVAWKSVISGPRRPVFCRRHKLSTSTNGYIQSNRAGIH